MSDYYEELGHTETLDEEDIKNEKDLAEKYKRLHEIAIIIGIDMNIELPESIKHSIDMLPDHYLNETDCEFILKCSVCKMKTNPGDKYKKLLCNHMYHNECILMWCKKVITDEKVKLCPNKMCTLVYPLVDQLRELQQNNIDLRQRYDENRASMFS